MINETGHWRTRDWIASAALFFATAAVILWQDAHIAVLWDLSYVLDTANRIALGQMPYRDFPLAHAPLTFLIQAAILRIAGRVYFPHILYAALAGGLGSVLTWRIALRILRARVPNAWTVSLLLAATLTVLGIYCILPQPSYDCDCALAILVSIWMFARIDDERKGVLAGLATGAALCLPVFFKQNIGLPFLAAALCTVLVVLATTSIQRTGGSPDAPRLRTLLAVLAGVAATLAAAALLIQATAGLNNYIQWTIRFAAQRRLPGLADMLDVYRDPSLLWTIPCVAAGVFLLTIGSNPALAAKTKTRRGWGTHIVALALLAMPFLWALYSLVLYDDADERGDSLLALWPLLLLLALAVALNNLFRRKPTLRTLLPLVLLAAVNGAMMSQQLWGSTYAIWPLLVLLIAELLAAIASAQRWFAPALAAVISITLLVCGGVYTASEERLSYAQFPAGPPVRSTLPQLAGLTTPGPWLPNFDELLRYASANIPFNDGILLIPGEDPFYFVTGRTPQFPVLLFDPATDPYSPQQAVAEVRARNIRWLIVKRNLQLNADPTPNRAALLTTLLNDFQPAVNLVGYNVYRRRP